MSKARPPVVAILNSNDDTVEMLRTILEPPPYDRSWLFFEHLRELPTMKHRRFVLTSTNPSRVQQIANTDQQILEIIGKPYDLQMITDAVKAALS